MQRLGNPQPTLGELFSELARETGTLVKQEVQLAKSEMVAKSKVAAGGIAWAIAGGALMMVGGLALMTAIIAALALVMPVWLAALVTGTVVAGVGATMTMHGVHALKRLDPVPRQTLQTLKEDGQWISEQVSR